MARHNQAIRKSEHRRKANKSSTNPAAPIRQSILYRVERPLLRGPFRKPKGEYFIDPQVVAPVPQDASAHDQDLEAFEGLIDM